MENKKEVLFQTKNGLDGLLTDAKADVTMEKGYEFLSRNRDSISSELEVVHVFLRLKSATNSNGDIVQDDLYLHILESEGKFYWDHTDFVTFLMDELDEDEMSALSNRAFCGFSQTIKPLLPVGSSLRNHLEKELPIQIL